ncbi:MAG: 1-(5-phosphoribosyl)-5-[(5-phosphoribosylamino)methylideneamino]imidazole-4-carboxamide isomerase [Parvularculaceae bacterium]|nr:1-(5-phosphoribosyl)-5-[(5-phosphoribosylamino)methylideneamino]imidazole-4-carboxamide isomerase [Parvularculaceae bacterium]
MTIYPAIDLKAGKCVRLLHGEMDSATVYNDDPAAQARAFEALGYDRLHIVDLDGAFAGDAANAAAVHSIIGATKAACQLGGGVRSMAAVAAWLERGVTRVILGTAAVKDPEFVREAAAAFPGAIVVGIDARDGRVKTDGWAGDTGHTALEIGKRYEDQGVAAIIFTDISRDGALGGVNVEATSDLAEGLAIPVIASGGVGSTADIRALAHAHRNIEGVIIGRAFYDGRLDPVEIAAAAIRPSGGR